MNKDELKRMGNNPDFIAGIHNYCDRWCQRCTHSSKCMVFAMEQESFDVPKTKDINNKKFWAEIASSLQTAIELLEEIAEDLDLDFSELDSSSITVEEIDKMVVKHPLSKMSQKYSEEVNKWFENATGELKTRGIQLEKKAEMGFPEKELVIEAKELNDRLEIVRWYQHQIHIKIQRALQGQMDEFETDPIQNDANGSAKVAFIGISRSIAAWAELYNEYPAFKDEILDILALLEKLRSFLQEYFPNLHKFQRPGFDE